MTQCYVVSEQQVLVEVTPPTVLAAVKTIMAVYYCLYIEYPKSSVPANNSLLFLQETVVQDVEGMPKKKTTKLTSLVNSLLPNKKL